MNNLRHTICYYLWHYFSIFGAQSPPSRKKKLQSSTIAVNINVGPLNQEWKKIKVCGIYDNSKLGFVKKRGANKNSYLLPIFLSDLLPKKRIRNPTQTQYINFQNRGRSPKNIRYHRLRSSMPVTENSSLLFSSCHLELERFCMLFSK